MWVVNSRVGIMQVNLSHVWDNFEAVQKVCVKKFGNSLSKERMCSSEGNSLLNFVKEIFLR
jgi:hypothetical protein